MKKLILLTALLATPLLAQQVNRNLAPDTDVTVQDVNANAMTVSTAMTVPVINVTTLDIDTIQVLETLVLDDDISLALVNGDMTLTNGDLTLTNGTPTFAGGSLTISTGAWNDTHLVMGTYHIWNNGGELRIKSSAPTSATDGAAIGGGGGGGDMLAATYDAANVSEQLVGLTAAQNLQNKTYDSTNVWNGGDLVQPDLRLKNATTSSLANTGDIIYETASGFLVYRGPSSSNRTLVTTANTQELYNKTLGATNTLSGVQIDLPTDTVPSHTEQGRLKYGTNLKTLYVGDSAGTQVMLTENATQFVENKQFTGSGNKWYGSGGNIISLAPVATKPATGDYGHDPYWLVMKTDGDKLYGGTNLPTAGDVSTWSSDEDEAEIYNKDFGATNEWIDDFYVDGSQGRVVGVKSGGVDLGVIDSSGNYRKRTTGGTEVIRASATEIQTDNLPIQVRSSIQGTVLGAINSDGSLQFLTATNPSQTTEGVAVWDSDDDRLGVGAGSNRVWLESRKEVFYTRTINAVPGSTDDDFIDIFNADTETAYTMEVMAYYDNAGDAVVKREEVMVLANDGEAPSYTVLDTDSLNDGTGETVTLTYTPDAIEEKVTISAQHNQGSAMNLTVRVHLIPLVSGSDVAVSNAN